MQYWNPLGDPAETRREAERFAHYGDEFATATIHLLDEVERLRAKLAAVEKAADALSHQDDCLTEQTGHDPSCNCGLYALYFELRRQQPTEA